MIPRGCFFDLVLRFTVVAAVVLPAACKSRREAVSSGVVGKPGALSGETVAIVLYEYSFEDPALPAAFVMDARTRKQLPVANALCLYSAEYEADLDISSDQAVTIFKSARPVTARAISRAGLNRETEGFWEGLRSVLSLRSSPVWAGGELAQDEIYGMREASRQAVLRDSSTGIRTLRRYVEAARANEDANGVECPVVHPKAEKIVQP